MNNIIDSRVDDVDFCFDCTVFTNGCFDLFHPGHLKSLEFTRKLAGDSGIVVVGVNSNDSVRSLKGSERPVYDEYERASLVAACRFVDYVIIFDEETPEKLIESLDPCYVIKGSEYNKKDIISNGRTVVVHEMDSRWSTTKLIEKIKREF